MWSVLWPALHKEEYSAGPKCDLLYNVLYQMGIYPNMRTFRLGHNQRYASIEEAFLALQPQAGATTKEQIDILREYLQRAICQESGAFVLPGSSTRVKIWWEKDQHR